ncbi:MAG TPA: LEPR-XLL domain-containing protein, partial [Gammaproteobacteria bacterium]|nr:LEPR-XLL domain-containing protein [Gammaproteobacteria bacterium]
MGHNKNDKDRPTPRIQLEELEPRILYSADAAPFLLGESPLDAPLAAEHRVYEPAVTDPAAQVKNLDEDLDIALLENQDLTGEYSITFLDTDGRPLSIDQIENTTSGIEIGTCEVVFV